MKQDYLDMLRQVLDHEVIDANNIPCGMVDDLEIEGGPGEPLTVKALLIGPGAWTRRLPRLIGPVARAVFGRGSTRVPWEEVSVITENVKLRSRASELGLDRSERKAAAWIRRLPGA